MEFAAVGKPKSRTSIALALAVFAHLRGADIVAAAARKRRNCRARAAAAEFLIYGPTSSRTQWRPLAPSGSASSPAAITATRL